MNIYSHCTRDKERWHLIRDHLRNTAVIGSLNAAQAGLYELANFVYTAGMVHDMGKYKDDFFRVLMDEPIRVDHSTSGAKLANDIYGTIGKKIISSAVAGHHAGLPDYGSANGNNATLTRRLIRSITKQEYAGVINSYLKENTWPAPEIIQEPEFNGNNVTPLSFYMFVKFLFAFLIDADRLDAENFMSSCNRSFNTNLAKLRDSLDSFIEEKRNNARPTHVNNIRDRVLRECREKAINPPGFYTLTVPTGGGKTISSLAFALDHAIEHKKDRIINAIPYTSIIEQNAEEFKKALGAENVLEHHSNVEPDRDDYRAITEDWRAPVIVTTNIQLFESIFSCRPTKSRKLSAVANSVIILDEAQMIPVSYRNPCLLALIELVNNYNCTVVFCTATQPALQEKAIDRLTNRTVSEIIDDPDELFRELKRVEVQQIGSQGDNDIAKYMNDTEQILCIVNTKEHARSLYKLLEGEGCFHLSTTMCAELRSKKIAEIKERLSEGKPCRVVSTQLIEAGVDVDFPVGIRSEAGVENIAQAAGRIRREGGDEEGILYVFSPLDHHEFREDFQRAIMYGNDTLEEYEDPFTPEAVEYYFRQFYGDSNLDREGIQEYIEQKYAEFEHRKIDAKFNLIDDDGYTVYVAIDNYSRSLLQNLDSLDNRRAIQRYGAKLSKKHFNGLVELGIIEEMDGIYYILDAIDEAHDNDLGVLTAEEIIANRNRTELFREDRDPCITG